MPRSLRMAARSVAAAMLAFSLVVVAGAGGEARRVVGSQQGPELLNTDTLRSTRIPRASRPGPAARRQSPGVPPEPQPSSRGRRRELVIGLTAVGLGIPALSNQKHARGVVQETAKKVEEEKKSALERGLGFLAKAERQAVETVAGVEIDPNDGNEYWVLGDALKKRGIDTTWLDRITGKQKFRVLKRKVSDTEVVLAGLVAGALVEAARILLLHPLDTVKTRLQAYSRPKPPTEDELKERQMRRIDQLKRKINVVDEQMKPKRQPSRASYGQKKTVRGVKLLRKIALEERLNVTQDLEVKEVSMKIPSNVFASPWDGLSYALLTSAPQGAVYWAVRDVVKRNLIQAAPPAAGVAGAKAGALAGFWGLVTHQVAIVLYQISSLIGPLAPALALDYRSAATLVAVSAGEAMYWAVRTPGEILKTQRQTEVLESNPLKPNKNPLKVLPGLLEVFRIYPILALVDLPQLVGRVWVFLILHNSPHTATTEASDLFFYTLSAMVAAGACTPLDVARTRLLLQRQKDRDAEYDRMKKMKKAREEGRRAAEDISKEILRAQASAEKKEELSEKIDKMIAIARGGGAVAGAASAAAVAATTAAVGAIEEGSAPSQESVIEAAGKAGEEAAAAELAESVTRDLARESLQPKSPSDNPRYDGIVDCLRKIWRDEGWAGLFAGVGYRMLWNGLVVGFVLGVQRTSYEGVRTAFMFKFLDQLNQGALPTEPVISQEEPDSPTLVALGVIASMVEKFKSFADGDG